MERCVADDEISRVLILLDPRYAERADGREGGVGTETLIISPQVYREADQEKFIPVVMDRDEDGTEPIPAYLAGRIYIDLSDPETEDDHYERLVRNIYGNPERARPPLGKPPAFLQDDAPQLRTGRSLPRLKEAVHHARANVGGYLDDYFDRLVDAYREERLEPDDGEELDQLVVQSIEHFRPHRDEYLDLVKFLARHVPTIQAYEHLHRFFERLLAVRHEVNHVGARWEHQTENLAWVAWEMFLYTTAILLDAQRFDAIPSLLEPYYVESGYSGRGGMRDFGTVNPGFYVVDRIRRDRLDLRFQSVSANLLRERSQVSRVKFDSLMAADLVLWFRAVTGSGSWYPRTLYYGEMADPPALFVRARSAGFSDRLMPVLGVSGPDAFREAFAQIPGDRFPSLDGFGGRTLVARLMAVEQIGTYA